MTPRIRVVVARYNENLDWIEPMKDLCIIYNKGEHDVPYPYIPLKNVGNEGETYLRYIIDNYDNLPEYTCFTQGSIKEHMNTPEFFEVVVKKVNGGMNIKDGYKGLNQVNGYFGWGGLRDFDDPVYHPNLPIKDWWDALFDVKPKGGVIICNYAGIFIVSQENIHFHSKAFYQKLYDMLMEDPITGGYVLERLWTTIFDEDYKNATKIKS